MSLFKTVLVLAALVAPSASAQEFPQVFEHRFGASTLAAKPERVVTLSYIGQDHFLALGVVPVGTRDFYGDYPHAAWPWAQQALGDGQPVLLDDAIAYEKIAALDPDVIEAMWSGISEAQYAELSKIAPVIAAEAKYTNWNTPWDVQAITIGRIVGQETAARAQVDDLNKRFADIAASHPEWQGKTMSVASMGDQVEVYTSRHVISKMLGQLGFTTPAPVDAAAADGAFYTEFSPEDLSPLDADVVIWFSVSDDPAAVKDLLLRDRMQVHARGGEVFTGKVLSGAFSFASVLSLGFMLDQIIPELELAADGDAATVVPSAKSAGLTD